MSRIFLTITAALALLAAVSLSPNRAEAAAMPVPTGIQAAIVDSSMIEDVQYICRRVWQCGYYGCGWRRVCSYARPRYYRPYYRPYRYYRW